MSDDDRELVEWAKENPDATEVDYDSKKKVSDVGVLVLAASCPELTKALLGGTQVTDVGAQALASSCSNLTVIDVSNTQVTDAGKGEMAKALPDATIYVSRGLSLASPVFPPLPPPPYSFSPLPSLAPPPTPPVLRPSASVGVAVDHRGRSRPDSVGEGEPQRD